VIDIAGIQTSIEILRPVDEVFDFFLDPAESAAKMDPGSFISKVPPGPTKRGTTFVFRQNVLGRMRETKTHITAIDADQWIDFDAEIGPMRPRLRLSFEPTAQGTRVTLRGDSNPRGVARVLTPLMNRIGQRNWDARLRNAKAALEHTMML
jgi:hypothetical protein